MYTVNSQFLLGKKGKREKLRKGQKGGHPEWESSLIFLGEHRAENPTEELPIFFF